MAELHGGVLSRDVPQATELSAVIFLRRPYSQRVLSTKRLCNPEIAYTAIEECAMILVPLRFEDSDRRQHGGHANPQRSEATNPDLTSVISVNSSGKF